MESEALKVCKTDAVFLLASILAETSPQAVPLGAACTASALKIAFPSTTIQLVSISLEDAKIASLPAATLLAQKITEAAKLMVKNKLSETPFFIGFSVYVWNTQACAECVKLLQSEFTDVIFFAGGPSAAVEPFCASYDFIVEGEGEQIADNIFLSDYLTKTTQIVKQSKKNLEHYPSPWLDGTLSPADYNGVLWELSRGCPYNCAYCSESADSTSKNVKKRFEFPLERLERELVFFASVKVPQVYVLDPAFTANRERALTLIALMAKKLPEAHFQIEIRAEQLDSQLVKAFSNLICSLQIGLQSSNPEVLKKVGRAFDRKLFSRKIGLLNENDIVFGLDLIYGLPDDTLPSFKDSIDYAVSLYPNHLDIFRLSILPNTKLYVQAEQFGIKFDAQPPHLVQHTPKFSRSDLAKAETLAFACTVFYSAGRAVPWFHTIIQPLKIRPAQFFADFAEWQRCNNCASETGFDPYLTPHVELEKMQLAFLNLKYAEKKLDFAFKTVCDVVRLNGAFSRAVGEGDETSLDLLYHPDDLLEVFDIIGFAEEACMEAHHVRIFAGIDGPDMEEM